MNYAPKINHVLPKIEEISECLTVGEIALLYAKNGWPIFPCIENSNKCKAPYTKHGFKDATIDPIQIKKWWKQYPHALIGLQTGPETGLLVIDCDVRQNGNGIENYKKFIKDNKIGDIPNLLTVNTPSGGVHYYYSYPPVRNPIKHKLTDYVDIKANGGYVIAPGSQLSDGRRYAWVKGFDPHICNLRYPTSGLFKFIQKGPSVESSNQCLESINLNLIERALTFIPASDYQIWLRVGMALKTKLGEEGFMLWDQWSKGCSEKYDPKEQCKKWASFKGNGVNIETIFHYAREHGCNLSELAKEKQDSNCRTSKAEVKQYPAPEKKNALILTNASDVQPRPIKWLWGDKIPLGAFSIIAGQGGQGKSQIGIWLAALVSKGGCFPDGQVCSEGKVIIISAEDTKEEIIVPRLLAAGSNLANIKILEAVKTTDDQGNEVMRPTFDFELDLPVLNDKLTEISGVKLIIIDPIMSFMGKVNTHNLSETRVALAPLADLAEKHELAALLIHHTNKSTGGNAYTAFSGSNGFVDASRASFLVGPCPDQSDSSVMAPVKANWGTGKASFQYRIQSFEIEHEEGTISTSLIEWLGECPYTADEIRGAYQSSDGYGALEEAVEFLKEVLACGSKPASEIKDEAVEQGVSESTLNRAKRKLKIKANREGGSKGQWVWCLPEEGKDAQRCSTSK